MKKLKITVLLPLLLTLILLSCRPKPPVLIDSGEGKTRNSTSVYLEAMENYNAEVDQWFGVTLNPQTFTIGSKTSGFITKNYKSVLTFNTSSIPANAIIDYVFIGWTVAEVSDPGQGSEYWQNYIEDNLKAEFAPLGGFNGSYIITGYDYYAYAVASSALDSYGFMLMTKTTYVHINRNGYTQLRVTFQQNPDNQYIILRGPGSQYQYPYLKVVYHTE